MGFPHKWLAILAVLGIVVLVASACGATPTPQVLKETVVVTQEVEKLSTVVVTQEVEKVVEQTVVVEVTSTPVAGAEPVTLDGILGSEPPTIDPAVSEDTTSVWVVEQLFAALTDYDDTTLEVVPELATSWDVSEDGVTYTFHLRDDVKWVNYAGGNTTEIGIVTANDVVYGVRRTLDPRTGSPYAYVLNTYIVAEEFNTADSSVLSDEELTALRDAVGVAAPDDVTFVVTLSSLPRSSLPSPACG